MTKTATSFWQNFSKPIIGLSPMDGVTDHPYRFIQKKYGNPDLIYTEFTNVEGLCHGAEKLLTDFLYDETQRTIIAQIYGTTPKYFRQAATILCELGFDGVDINMGCPAKTVASSGAGAALIKNPELAKQIIIETKAGVTDFLNGKRARDCEDIRPHIVAEVEKRHAALPPEHQQKTIIPVSVKTRIGYDKPVIEEWIPWLLEQEPAAIALHGRTLKQQYSGFASWDHIGQAAQLCKQTTTKMLGNGDISDLADAQTKITIYGLDGTLIGRASFGNPFIFLGEKTENPNSLFQIAIEHSRLFEQTYSPIHPRYSFMPMRKHLGWYCSGFDAAKEVRAKLFLANSAADVETVFKEYNLI